MTEPQLTSEHFAVVVVGAGQAGLSASWHLTRQGIEHVLLERATVAHEWQAGRWDNFTLVTPNWQCRLPGYAYPGDDPDGFMTRDEVSGYLADYTARLAPPVREHVAVRGLQQADEGGFLIETVDAAGISAVLTADQVIVATGGYHQPRIPRLAERLPRHVHQVHSSRYRSPDQLPAGAVLVVGTGQSRGADRRGPAPRRTPGAPGRRVGAAGRPVLPWS